MLPSQDCLSFSKKHQRIMIPGTSDRRTLSASVRGSLLQKSMSATTQLQPRRRQPKQLLEPTRLTEFWGIIDGPRLEIVESQPTISAQFIHVSCLPAAREASQPKDLSIHRLPQFEIPSSLREQELLRPQLLDHVAQLSGFLELEALGRLAHVGLELGDISIQFFLRFELDHAFAIEPTKLAVSATLVGSAVHFASVGDAGYVDSLSGVVNFVYGPVISNADAPFVSTARQFLAARWPWCRHQTFQPGARSARPLLQEARPVPLPRWR